MHFGWVSYGSLCRVGRPFRESRRRHYAGRDLSDEEALDALLAHPILMERPIVMRGGKAVVARPAERVLELF